MNFRHCTSRSSHPLGKAIVGLCSLLVCLLISSGSASAADAGGSGGSVSYSIRLEVGLSGLNGGGYASIGMEQNGPAVVREVLVPNLITTLADRYQRRQVEEIIASVANQSVVVIDGQGFAVSPSQETWVASSDGTVHSI
jgi:hypothetical protein